MKADFSKQNGLIPVIIQDAISMKVLMLGYMNEEALNKTRSEGKVTFYSRSKQRLWTKGETSGNYLKVVSMKLDCDSDSILIQAKANGPTCHTGSASCFGENESKGFIYELENTIDERITQNDPLSYTNRLFRSGINKVAQKVGEEAVELVIEAKDTNDELFVNEAADLMYHLLILLRTKNKKMSDVEKALQQRSK